MVGKEILGYHVDEKIGAGGFGTVYKVSKTNAAGTYVRALKHITLPTKKQYASVLNSMGGDYAKADDYFAGALADIVNEIRILSTLSESGVTNIVRYYENDIIETQSPKTYDIYIMMEYLTPFPDYLESRAFTVRDVIGLGKDILRALISCHEKNIIHRDIKDDNIFVSPDGIYKLGDFGVSKALKDKSRAESVKGTPNFIAPEVYLGKEKYDNTVDLYSLGIVLYKLLNKSRNPFLPAFPAPYSTADEDAAFEARMTGQIPELPVGAQNQLGHAVLKAIMPRAQRYDTAAQFMAALEAAEASMSESELSAIACEAIMPNAPSEAPVVSAPANNAANETFGVDFATAEEDVGSHEDRHLFDTFASPSAASTPASAPAPAAPAKPASTPAPSRASAPAPQQEPRTAAPSSSHAVNSQYVPSQKKAPASKSGSGVGKTVLLFGLSALFLLAYVLFFVIIIPLLYGQGVSFVTWLLADVNKLSTVMQNANNFLVPAYAVIVLIILQYVILCAFIACLVFACKSLHKPRAVTADIVKYTGKAPVAMLENTWMTLKNNPLYSDKDTLTTLRTVTDSFKYSKPFGYSKDMNVVKLENEICRLIDTLQTNAASDSANILGSIAPDVQLLKQKNALRDTMIKR